MEVEYKSGRKAVLTIYHDGEEQDSVTLSDFNTKEEMHQLMVDKGFEKKSEEEIVVMKEEKRKLQEEEEKKKKEARERKMRERTEAREKKERERKEKEGEAKEKETKNIVLDDVPVPVERGEL